ncbi:DegT/DnrJ/EryC1/StrS family aminotransferase [Desertivirga arenae]|uniref:DegT/DnrJ/EryC1/StrS family aminotransferase n=1 Tax=Desertivirga arenae TaxID=2810309 RepID=UPI001A96761E|nr:DegT/DnrJ/EryC1/StrS family aminotransferase [Pedobacter sp. SYSU D00823]
MSIFTGTKVWLSSPHMSGREDKYVNQAFATNWVAPLGPNLDAFELALSNYTQTPYVAALSSGTAALHLALIMLGVGEDDFVLTQSLTFTASANPVRYLGGTPVFIDSEYATWNMCPESLEEAILACLAGQVKTASGVKKAKLPKAIIPVHLFGMPCQMTEITRIAEKYGIPVIEDSAEALGSTYKGRHCGTLSTLGVVSFNGNKIITTSGGGALFSNDKSLIDRAKFLATQARDQAVHYEHSQIGYNYRLSNVLAGIGLGQLEVIEDRVKARRDNFFRYQQELGTQQGITFQEEPSDEFFSNYWLTSILINPKETGGVDAEFIRRKFEERNIETRPVWKPLHTQPVFKDFPYFGNGVAEHIFNRGLCLPSGSNLSFEDFDRIFECFDNIFNTPVLQDLQPAKYYLSA